MYTLVYSINKEKSPKTVYVNLTNACTNSCIFCLRTQKDDVCGSDMWHDDEYELEEDEYEYLIQYCLISADGVKKFKIYAEEGISGHEPTEDIGIITNIINGEYETHFALRTTDLCMSSFKVIPLSDDYPKEHPISFKNPINKILIEMIDYILPVLLAFGNFIKCSFHI